MAAECVELSGDDRAGEQCRTLGKPNDCFPVISGDLGSEPVIDFKHRICYHGGHAWELAPNSTIPKAEPLVEQNSRVTPRRMPAQDVPLA